jgi:AcrR family transcriptional regulator
VNTEISTRQRILNAAIEIASEKGIKALTQSRVAQAAGVRQSHLTYYFPLKADLLAAVLEASHHQDGTGAPKNLDEAMTFLEALMFEPHRMRFFLGAVVEAGEEKELRNVLANHAHSLSRQIAPLFNRPVDDPDVEAFVDRLRGIGLRLLLEPECKDRPAVDLKKIAAECGLG